MHTKISIGITTYNSADWVIKQLNLDYLTNLKEIVDEIIIQDDCSSDYNILKQYETDKVKIFTNKENLSPLLNRVEMLKNCKNDWVLIMDSDNNISFTSTNGVPWVDVVKSFFLLDKKTIYSPGFINHPGYTKILEEKIDINFFKTYFNDPTYYLQMFGNTGNYLVPRKEYLKISEQINTEFCHYIGEVLYFNYLWLKNGNYIICKKDFEYHHTIRQDGYTITNFDRSRTKLQKIYNLFN
jgi:glycosyltransferase involved in cell wall biosynthesis